MNLEDRKKRILAAKSEYQGVLRRTRHEQRTARAKLNEQIARAISDDGLSQADVARVLGVKPQRVWTIVEGLRRENER